MTTRPRVPTVGVGCVMMRGGHILLIRRHGAHGAGSWSPPGGHLHFGETPAVCAAREAEEETGIKVSNVDFLAITNDVFPEADKHYITIWMYGEPDDGDAVIGDAGEVAEIGWFDPRQLPSPLFLAFANLVSRRCLPISARLDS
jgi:8-oxo-dGTP diphosphatase